MGRYYSGDIEGKFWFGVQSSDDASFFGGEETAPNYLEYSFSKENDLATVTEGIKKCKAVLGEWEAKLDTFFDRRDGYNDEMIAREFEIAADKVSSLLEWYARLQLGNKILNCLEETGYCNFNAEL